MLITRFQSAGWSPARLSPRAWWRADTGLTLSGANVTHWVDVANGYDLTPGVSPTWSATGWNSSKPAVSFNGTNQYLQNTNAGLATQGDTAVSIIATLRHTTTGAYRTICNFHDPTFANWLQFFSITPSNAMGADDNGTVITDQSSTGTRRLIWSCDGVNLDQYSDTATSAAFAFAASMTTGVFWCGVDIAGAGYFKSDLAELIVCNGALPAGTPALYQDYSNRAWGS